MKSLLIVLSMLAVGVLVWRALQRQEARHAARDGDDPVADEHRHG